MLPQSEFHSEECAEFTSEVNLLRRIFANARLCVAVTASSSVSAWAVMGGGGGVILYLNTSALSLCNLFTCVCC